MPKPVKERLLDKTTVAANGCWVFTGAVNSRGYGCISNGGRVCLAHRVSFEVHVGEIPAGLTIDHLEPVTVAENNRRAPAHGYGKTHCIRGHEFTAENTHVNGRGTRSCKTCARVIRAERDNKNSGRTSSAYWAARRAS